VRRRLLALAVSLVGVVLIALMAPLISTYAADRTQDLFVDRLADVTRFSVLAQDALELGDSESLATDLARYAEVYGGSVLVTQADRQVVVRSGPETDPRDERVPDMIDAALSGRSSPPPDTAWPWSDDHLVIGSPVGRDAQVLGAVVMVVPTASVQHSVATWLLWLLAAGLATLLLTVFGVVAPFVGWVMRPVHDLDDAAKRLASGDLASRAHHLGPPELRELASTFNVMADNVETSQRQQRELVADAAHQLGNPLTSLRLRLESLGPDAGERQVETVLEETDRLSNIVESLLDLSQVGASTAELVEVDVAALTRHRCELWAPVFEPALTLQSPPSAPALATHDLVDVVLDALLDNASKFAPGAAVEVSVRAEPDRVVLGVRDHGAGLDPEDAGKVGARFFRGRQHQNVAGTGLGLAIVRARVEDVGGSMEVGLAEGGGLQVAVVLPPVRQPSPGSSGPRQDAARPVR
jgi:signal transduction histidine kinase